VAIEACAARHAAASDTPEAAPARARALETLAWAWLEEGDEAKAIEAGKRMPKGFAPSPVLAARLVLAEGRVAEGFRLLERAYHDTPGDLPAIVLGAAYVERDRPDRAVAMLRGIRGLGVTSQGHLVVSAAVFYAGHHAHALELSELAWNRFSQPVHAYNAACACAKLGRIEDGLDWLARAIDRGFHDRAQIEGDADLEPLRKHRRWAEVLARLPPAS
jgi:uncharacterized membrane-anchored protein